MRLLSLRRSRRLRRGFTLIELAMGVAAAAMLLFLTAKVFSTALRARETLQKSSVQTESLRRAFESISRDLHSAVVPPDDSGLQFGLSDATTGGSVGSNGLQFASVVGEPLLAGRQASETVLIQYSIAEDPRTGKPTLFRYATPYPVPEGTAAGSTGDTQITPLISGVVGASYVFYSADQNTWLDTWDGSAGLPSAIRMDLILDDAADATRSRTTTAPEGSQKQESWTFQLPAARYANDRAAEAALAEEEAGTGTGSTTGTGATTGAGGAR